MGSERFDIVMKSWGISYELEINYKKNMNVGKLTLTVLIEKIKK
jgi:hypothetical protein